MATSFEDIHQDIIQKHILPLLDGPSLRTTATATASSSHLRHLYSDDKLWADVSMSTWPSITHPRVHELISTFPNGHRSFFDDSFPSLFTHPSSLTSNSRRKDQWLLTCDHHLPCELISLVDIRYKGTIIYSTAHFTKTTTEHFLSSPFKIVLDEPTHEPQKFDEVELTNNKSILPLFKDSVTLNWVIINPTQKRAGNLSTIKPVRVKCGWMPDEVVLQYITVLPGCNNPNEMVKCRIQLILYVAGIEGDAILEVKEVSLKLQDLLSRDCLNGKDFMVITQRAILEENNVRRTVIDDERRLMSYKQMKKDKKYLEKKEEEKTKFVTKMNFAGILVSFCFSMYLLSSLVD